MSGHLVQSIKEYIDEEDAFLVPLLLCFAFWQTVEAGVMQRTLELDVLGQV